MELKEYGLSVYVEGQEHPEYIHWTSKKFTRAVIKEITGEVMPDGSGLLEAKLTDVRTVDL